MVNQGECPECGSLNVDYGPLQEFCDGSSELYSDQSVYYPATCLDCGCHFNEVYDLEFTGSEVANE